VPASRAAGRQRPHWAFQACQPNKLRAIRRSSTAAAWAERQGIAPHLAAEALTEVLLQGDLSPDARALVMHTGSDGRPDSLRRALQLLAHCPEYQLA